VFGVAIQANNRANRKIDLTPSKTTTRANLASWCPSTNYLKSQSPRLTLPEISTPPCFKTNNGMSMGFWRLKWLHLKGQSIDGMERIKTSKYTHPVSLNFTSAKAQAKNIGSWMHRKGQGQFVRFVD
jgi:hypothetical protein